MNIKGFILYGKIGCPCNLVIKNGEIVEYNSKYFKDIYPKDNNSALSVINTIEKAHNPERIQNYGKYYVRHPNWGKNIIIRGEEIEGEDMNIFFNISVIQYWKLKWQLKKFVILSVEFKRGLIITFIVFILGIIGFYIQEYIKESKIEPSQEHRKELKSENLDDLDVKSDTILIKKDTINQETNTQQYIKN